MDYSEVLDIGTLLAPISDSSPVGADPRDDISPTSRYFTLKDVRNQARANERAALVDDDLVSSVFNDWRPIAEQIPEALTNECKDLEYAAWLIEALCRLEGFSGLAAAFRLTRELIENYWDSIYPLPDEDGLETRIAPIIGLNGYDGEGSLITPIVSIPITPSNGEQAYATWQYTRAAEIALLDEEKQRQKADSGIATLEEIESVIKETPIDFYQNLVADLQSAIDEFKLLSDAMDAAMSGTPQPTSMISKSLAKCYEAIRYFVGDRLDQAVAENEESLEVVEDEDGDASSAGTVVSQVPKKLETRDQAIRMLKEVSDFFHKTEPHSPMPYAIDQVVRWSGLSLPELLQELIDDGGSRNQYFRLTGIPVGE
ncbi:type VI secretion system protein TssA [Litoribrevibacter albus]|uniref:Type VI secretion protein n=1 Tax=Litoribrevibacter albus TaxID=1473156 RepID=A0AA37SB46_9GAMM|nr:type VI secretion system protein TssA [Litoribrevibacter albus]GLQ31850.1 type VI secretion protein [Litoribrevibacter albus]